MLAPKISILIATLNRASYLTQTLDSLNCLRLPQNLEVELLVVDNGSIDHTPEILRNAQNSLRIPMDSLFVGQRGKSRAINAAAAQAKGSVLLFTDDDVRPDADWIERMTRPLLNGVAEAAQGGIRLASYLQRPWLTPLQRGWIAERVIRETQTTSTGSLTGANMAVTRSVFSQLGGLDEEIGPGAIGASEESLLALRLNDAGHRTIYVPNAEVEHHCSNARITRPALIKAARDIGKSLGYIYHHWLHIHAALPSLRAMKHATQLWASRMGHTAAGWRGEPCDWELELVRDVWLWRQYTIERHRPPKYARTSSRKKL